MYSNILAVAHNSDYYRHRTATDGQGKKDNPKREKHKSQPEVVDTVELTDDDLQQATVLSSSIFDEESHRLDIKI